MLMALAKNMASGSQTAEQPDLSKKPRSKHLLSKGSGQSSYLAGGSTPLGAITGAGKMSTDAEGNYSASHPIWDAIINRGQASEVASKYNMEFQQQQAMLDRAMKMAQINEQIRMDQEARQATAKLEHDKELAGYNQTLDFEKMPFTRDNQIAVEQARQQGEQAAAEAKRQAEYKARGEASLALRDPNFNNRLIYSPETIGKANMYGKDYGESLQGQLAGLKASQSTGMLSKNPNLGPNAEMADLLAKASTSQRVAQTASGDYAYEQNNPQMADLARKMKLVKESSLGVNQFVPSVGVQGMDMTALNPSFTTEKSTTNPETGWPETTKTQTPISTSRVSMPGASGRIKIPSNLMQQANGFGEGTTTEAGEIDNTTPETVPQDQPLTLLSKPMQAPNPVYNPAVHQQMMSANAPTAGTKQITGPTIREADLQQIMERLSSLMKFSGMH